ncbi:MAG: phosphotransferase family protein [Dehalococcoidia bacterium]
MTADPASPAQVADALRAHLADALASPDLSYAEPPAPITTGWETYIYAFRLASPSLSDERFAGPLILRIYPGPLPGAARVAQLEYRAQAFVRERGFPAPTPLLLETEGAVFGQPFMLMERVPGRPMLDVFLERPTVLPRMARLFAETQVRLHRIDPADAPFRREVPLLDRMLEEFRQAGEQFDLEGLRPGLDWLEAHRPPDERDVCIVHKDFHPVNVMVEHDAVTGVLDWPNVDLTDRHADLGFTLFLLETAVAEPRSLRERLIVGFGRRLLTRLYLRAYRRHLPVDRGLLRYYRSLLALRRTGQYGVWRQVGAEATGSKPDTAARVDDEQVETVIRYFHKHTGVQVSL